MGVFSVQPFVKSIAEPRQASARPHRLELSLLAAVLCLAAILRMGWPGLSEFKADEARLTALALDLAEGKALPLRGIGASVGLPNSPLSVYLYALPLFLWRSPISAVLFTGALNVLGVWLCWWAARRYWGAAAGLCAAALFAAAPWAVIYSRKIWAQNLLAPVALAYVVTAMLVFVEGHRRALAAHLALLAATALIHYSGLALAPLTFVWLILFRRMVAWRWLLAGLGLAALLGLPFAVYLASQGGQGGEVLARLLGRPAAVDWESLRFWWMTATGSDIHSLAGSPGYAYFLRSVPNLDPVRWTTGALVVAGIAMGLGAFIREASAGARAAGIVAMWALAPLAFFWRHSTPVFPHYFSVSLPAQFLAAGLALGRAFNSHRVAPKWGVVAATAAIVVMQAGFTLALFRFIGAHTTPGGYGIPLRFLLRAAASAQASGAPVVVAAPGDDPNVAEWPAVFDVLLRGTPHRFVDGARLALFPAPDAVLLITPGAGAAVQLYATAGAVTSADAVPNRRGDEPFYVARLSRAKAWGALAARLSPAPEPRRLANGVEFVAYRLSGEIAPGAGLEWWIAWQVAEAPPDPAAAYHIFNHLVAADGARWAQADSATAPAKDWTPGDVFVQTYRMEVSPEAGPGWYWMRVGMYTYPALENQPALDEAGNPAAEAVRLGPAEGWRGR